VRRRTIAEALRVLKPGGRLVIVDYHRPSFANPLYGPMAAILKILEPFAMDLWRHEIDEWLPDGMNIEKSTRFGGLYQRVTITKR
jgi:SAM-dependent methyltransferase